MSSFLYSWVSPKCLFIFTVLIFAAKTHCSHISPEAVLMLSLSSSGLLRSTAVDYKVINKLLLSTCSFCVLVLWFLLALFHFYFTSHREIFCWFTAFDLTGRAGCKNVTIHLFPNIKSSPTGSSTESTVKQVMVLGEPSMFEFEGFLMIFH